MKHLPMANRINHCKDAAIVAISLGLLMEDGRFGGVAPVPANRTRVEMAGAGVELAC